MTSVIAVFKPEPPDIDHECTPLDGIHDSGAEESRESSSLSTNTESQIPGLESLLEPKCELFDGIELDPENPTPQSTVTPFVNAAGHVIRVPSSLASTILATSSSSSVPIYYSKSSSAQEARIRNLYSKLPQIITVHPPTSSGSTRDLAPNSSSSNILNQHSTSTIMVGPLGPVQNRGQVPIIRATTIMSTPTSAPTLVSPSSTTKTSGSHSSTIPIINSVLSSTFSGTIPASGVRMQPIMVVVRPDGTVQALPTPLTSSTVNCSRTAFMNGPSSSFGSITSSASKISLPSTSNNQFREYSRELTRTTIPIGNNQHRQISDKMAEKIRQFRELNAKYRALKKQKRLKRMRKFESQRRNLFWNGNRSNDVVEFCDPDDSNISSTNSNTNSFDSEATEVDSSTISSGTNVPVVPEIRKITAAISTVASISTSSAPISNLITTSSGITTGRIILGTQASATRTTNAQTIAAIGSSTLTTISTASGTTNSSITISGVSGTGDGAKKVTKFVIPRDVLIKALAQQKQHQQQQQSGSGGITAKPLIYRMATSTGNVQFGIASSSLIRVAPVPTSSGSGTSSTISTVVVPETSNSTQQPDIVSAISTQPESEVVTVPQNTDGNSTEDTEIEEESVPEPLLIPPPQPLKAIAIDVNDGVPRIKQFKILRPSVPKSPPEIVKSPPKVPSPAKLPKSHPKAPKPVSGVPSQRYPGGRPRKYPPGDPRYKVDKRDQLRMLRKRKLANPAERKRQLEKARVNSRSYLERLTPEKKEARRRQALQCHKKRRQEQLKDPVKREELKVERRKQYLRTLEKETPEEKIIRLNRARESHKRNRRAKYGPKKKVGRPRKYKSEEEEDEDSPTDENSNSGEESTPSPVEVVEPVVKRGRGRPRKNPVAPAQSKIEPKLPTQSSNNIKKSNNTKKISSITEPELPDNQSSERRSGRKRTATVKFS